jgi:hypothetical protein
VEGVSTLQAYFVDTTDVNQCIHVMLGNIPAMAVKMDLMLALWL